MKVQNLKRETSLPAAGRLPAPPPTPGSANKDTRDDLPEKCRSRRRKCGSRLFSMLSDDQIRAAEKISRGFQLRTAGLSARTQSFNWQPKSAFVESGRDYALMQQFMSWAVAVQEAGLSVAVILDILVFGKSCRTVDKERNRRHGFARAYLLESLQIYENLFTKNPVR